MNEGEKNEQRGIISSRMEFHSELNSARIECLLTQKRILSQADLNSTRISHVLRITVFRTNKKNLTKINLLKLIFSGTKSPATTTLETSTECSKSAKSREPINKTGCARITSTLSARIEFSSKLNSPFGKPCPFTFTL